MAPSQRKSLLSITDVNNPDSLSNRMRQKRFALFANLTAGFERPLRILDIGGTARFWELRGWAGRDDVQITTVNLEAEEQRFENITPLAGTATDLSSFDDLSFDVAFSNSVIEHLESIENQQAMASELQRVAKSYWVQTPNFWFPIEPHFQYVGWQWMPRALRVAILRRRPCGRRGPVKDRARAEGLVDEVKLLTKWQLRALFPAGTIVAERFLGVVKSWIVHGPFEGPKSKPGLKRW